MSKEPQAPVRLREPGQTFQSTPFGLFALDPITAAIKPLDEPIEQIAAPQPATSRVAPTATVSRTVAPQKTQPAGPRQVIAAARARVKEIRAELKRMNALKRELGELERLLKAAREKPTNSVRALKRVG